MSVPPPPLDDLIVYWRQGEAIQNFGDFLSQYLFEELFLPIPLHPARTYLIGSVIADFIVGAETATKPSVVFWGCGAREEDGLSADAAAKARILAVRGPLTASALKLGATIPRGDPALLLPALYTPGPAVSAGRSVCIPHFWDNRTDAEQLAMSGCEQVLRPNLPNSRRRLLEMVDAIAASEFVLSASLHGAIVAAAYGRPFAFWDNGHLDVPFKWRDTAALLSVPAVFATDLTMGRAIHREQIAPTLRIAPLSPLIFSAPFPLRPEAVLRVLAHEARTLDDPSAVLLDWSARLATGGGHAAAAVRDLGEQLPLVREELAQANHRAQEMGAELAASRLEAKDNARALSATQADAIMARNEAALALAQRNEAEGRIALALEQYELLSSGVASRLELPPSLDPQALSHQLQLALGALRQDAADARAQANILRAELSGAGEEATLTGFALTEVTRARDKALQQLTVTARTEIRLREALRSATVRREYEQRFVTNARAVLEAQQAEIRNLHEQVTRAVYQRDQKGAEFEQFRSKLDSTRYELGVSAQLSRQALSEVDRLQSELDQTCERMQQGLLNHGRLEQELQSTLVKMGIIETELMNRNATISVQAMRWTAARLPKKVKQLIRSFVRASHIH